MYYQVIMSKRPKRNSDVAAKVEQKSLDKSPHIHQREKIKYQLQIRERNDLTERQKVVLETMLDRDTRCVLIDGIYGCAKTYTAVLAALRLMNMGKVDGIIYIRNPVESTTTGKLGYMPGEAGVKMAPYAAPLYDKLDELLPADDITALEKDRRIDIVPLGFVRGRSWNCKAIIVDEASSMSYDDIVLLLSRCGEFTRIFLVGDSLNQNDIGSKSGFRKVFDIFDDMDSKENGVYAFELREKADILRSGFVRFVMTKTGLIK